LLQVEGFSIFDAYVEFSTTNLEGDDEGKFNNDAVLPLVLLIIGIVALFVLLLNGITNKFKISFKMSLINILLYIATLVFLIYWSISKKVSPDSD